MKLTLVENQKKWDEFAAGQKNAQFLQSWSWGEFQKATGQRVWRVGFFEKEEMVGAAQIIEHYLGLGMGYLYSPRGPIANFSIKDLLDFIERKISNYGTLFLRVEPLEAKYFPPKAELNTKYCRVPSIQPSHVLLIDLSKSEEELLAAMHPKTRYNIRLAERKNLEFGIPGLAPRSGAGWNLEFDKTDSGFCAFWKLMEETAKRDKIRLHPKKYYETMSQIVSCFMFNVSCFKNLLAAGVFIGFGDTFTYVHGASSSQNREMMAPYFLHWQAIQFAKKAGYRYYDFGGVNLEDKHNFDYRPSWEGITRFKKGFGGFVHSYSGTFDVVLNKWGYKFYQTARKIRRLI